MSTRSTSLLLLLALFVGTCSGLVIGVDLGARYFKIGLLQAGKPYHIILNVESQRRTSTAVAFVSESEREFGNTAQNLATRVPDSTILLATTLLGRTNNSREVGHWFETSHLPRHWYVDEQRGTFRVKMENGLDFSVEEIVAMILSYGQELASAAAGVPISDAVIAVPPYFTHQQRVALIDAAKIAGITVTGLIHDTTAVALLYGVEKEKDFKTEEKPREVLFIDMGASCFRASVVRFGSTLSKLDKKGNKTVGEYWIKSVAWDETLGALAFDNVLVDMIASAFNAKRGVKDGDEKDVRNIPRAVAKMRKAAEKGKEVLSTIAATTISIEGLVEDTDFRLDVSNEDFAKHAQHLLDRVLVPIKQALKQAELEPSDLHSVETVGGGIRMPIVQSVLTSYLGKELGVSLNGDDAVGLGATLFAAKVSPAHRMREFVLRDASPYAIHVQVAGDESTAPISRQVFPVGGKMPVNKRLTLSRTSDFDVIVHYSPDQTLPAGTTKLISHHHVAGVSTALERHADEIVAEDEDAQPDEDAGDEANNASANNSADQTKKAKASVSLQLNAMGIVEIARSEVTINVFAPETPVPTPTPTAEDQAKEGDSATAEPATDKPESAKTEIDEKPTGTTDDQQLAESDQQATDKSSETAAGSEGRKTKTKHVSVTISEVADKDVFVSLTEANVTTSVARLAELSKADQARRELEAAKNELETHIYAVRNFLQSTEDIDRVCSEEDKEKILSQLTEAEDWLYEDGAAADLETYRTKLSEVREYSQGVRHRHNEMVYRPEVIEKARERVAFIIEKVESWKTVKPWINGTERVALINRTINFREWLLKAEEEQNAASLLEDPVLTTTEIARKLSPLENKFKKMAKIPKPAPPRKPANSTYSWSNSTKSGNKTSKGQKKNAQPDNTNDVPTSDEQNKQDQEQQQQQNDQQQDDEQQHQAGDHQDDVKEDTDTQQQHDDDQRDDADHKWRTEL